MGLQMVNFTHKYRVMNIFVFSIYDPMTFTHSNSFLFQHVPNDIYWYYITELAFYWSLVFTLFWDHRRKVFYIFTNNTQRDIAESSVCISRKSDILKCT